MTSVQKFKCPEVRLPPFDKNKKRKIGDMGWDIDTNHNDNRQSIKKSKSHMSKPIEKDKKTATSDEMKNIMSYVREFSSSVLTGHSKLDYRNKKLTDLGVPPPKQPTMPFKLRMALNATKAKKEAKQLNAAKQAGIILPKASKPTNKFSSFSSKLKKTKRRKAEDDGGTEVNLRTVRGVLRLKKENLPASLLG
mmetsp:Transcript_8107/g.8260  ORF Transcript_8107/g.8260 Transcript_8107/m.8260 type:complete len:193 (+) Transcript_8107:262-840(+)